MCALATRRFACYFNKNLPNAPDHAVLCYDTAAPDEMELFYRPVKRPLSEECLLSSLGLESVLLRHRRCILHASYICIDGKAILFTAPCGTGKSTQAELWKKFRGAKIINGDKALIRYDGERLLACGLPLCGSSEICLNEVFPIAAVVALAQEKKNSAARLRGGKAVKAVLPQIYTQPCEVDAVNGAFSAAISLAERAPIYFLRCLPDESAVECLEKALNKEI